jgi:hypothetical protein
LQQLAAQQLRITELEEELAAERKQAAAQTGLVLKHMCDSHHINSVHILIALHIVVQLAYKLSSKLKRRCRKS